MPVDSVPTKDERALTYLSVVFGSLAMVAYPLAFTFRPATVLMFTVPMAMATTGRLRGSRGLQRAALAIGLALAVTYAVGFSPIIEVVLTVGPALVLYLVTTLLREHDRTAAIVWAAAGAVAFAAGLLLLTVASNAGAGLAMSLVSVGLVVSILRLRRCLNPAR